MNWPTLFNWRTSLAGVIGALAANAVAYFQNNKTIDWKVFVLSMMGVGIAFLAKDFNTTGGTKVQPSNEAAKQAVLNPTAKETTDAKKIPIILPPA